MSAPNRDGSDDSLRKALRQWSVDDPLPRNFRAGVWDRIARGEAPAQAPGPWRGLILAVEHLFSRPAFAAAYVAVLLAAGVAFGYRHAQRDLASADAALSARYVQVVDPYQTPR